MPAVVVAATAERDLRDMVRRHSLPEDTRERVKVRLRPLARFPAMGPLLGGRWEGARYLLGPWPWMILIYEHLEDIDTVVVTTIQDAREAESAISTP